MKEIITLIIIALLLSPISPIHASSPEYVSMKVKGNSMAPTIVEGDTVKVRISNDGENITAGTRNEDLIVYCNIAALAYSQKPDGMWICHRVIEKFVKDGVWYFTTQGDNNPEPDEWEVPEYYMLGVVVDITSSRTTPNTAVTPESPPRDTETDIQKEGDYINPSIRTIGEFIIGLLVGSVLALLTTKTPERANKGDPRSPQKKKPVKADLDMLSLLFH